MFAGNLFRVFILNYRPPSRALHTFLKYISTCFFLTFCLCYPYFHSSALIMISCTSWNNLSPQAPILKKKKKKTPNPLYVAVKFHLPSTLRIVRWGLQWKAPSALPAQFIHRPWKTQVAVITDDARLVTFHSFDAVAAIVAANPQKENIKAIICIPSMFLCNPRTG